MENKPLQHYVEEVFLLNNFWFIFMSKKPSKINISKYTKVARPGGRYLKIRS